MIRKSGIRVIVLFLLCALVVPCFTVRADYPEISGSHGMIVPIIVYHNINHKHLSQMTISPYEFGNDLDYLRQVGYSTITVDDLIRYQANEESLPPKPIMITFDDGYLNTYAFAYPLLREHQMKAVLSVIGKDTDDFSKIDIKDLSYAHMNWDQIAELHNSGVFEIQNHTYNLHHASSKRYGCVKKPGESEEDYEKMLRADLEQMQERVLEKTGYLPTAFTYPYGKISPESVPVLKKLGFKASLTCDYGINVLSKDPDKLFGLKRIARYHGKPLKATLTEAYKTLH